MWRKGNRIMHTVLMFFTVKYQSCQNTGTHSTYCKTRNTCMQQPLALLSKQLYLPNMKCLKIVVIFTLLIFLQKNERVEKIKYNQTCLVYLAILNPLFIVK